MKEGDRVYHKKYKKWYNIIIVEEGFMIKLYDGMEEFFYEDMFDRYFLTEKEIRALKINQINETEN